MTQVAVHRVEVTVKPGMLDPHASALLRDAASLGLTPAGARSSRVYLVEAALSPQQLELVRRELLTNPVVEDSSLGASPAISNAQLIEVHPLPGVMDPAAQTVRDAIRDLTSVDDVTVSTGVRYDVSGLSSGDADRLASALLANPVIQKVHRAPFHPGALPHGAPYVFKLTHIPLTTLSDGALEKLSRDAHLFLDLHEMRAIRDYYREQGREPTDIELETLAQTWSEHCVHKTLKSNITYRGPASDVLDFRNRPGHTVNADGSVTIHNLLKSTVAAATHELIADGIDWALSIFKDNSGVIAFDDRHAINIKVETHNHPSAIEPYGGAATGVGGCIRDVIATGLGSKPIANTDVFCVAPPDMKDVPKGCLPPRRVLARVVQGVRDYGNRMGIPTVSGAVAFDERYVGNPLVYCGCIGVMPRDKIKGAARAGDLIVALGGRTGRDGIHGATFSSAELTDTHADEFAHAVQIGNAIEEKRLLDAILRARDHASGTLFSGITDCGAGGFSSAVGEMGGEIGASVHLDKAPLKYRGLSYTEIWISEAQERMVLAVPRAHLDALQRICDEEHVELAVLGTFGTPGAELVLHYHEHEVGRLSMHLLHEGIPTPTREAVWSPAPARPVAAPSSTPLDLGATLLELLAHPTIASKRWIIRQYDHEVQGQTIIKPLVGTRGEGPSDASVLSPVPDSQRALAISQGLASGIGDPDLPGGGGDPYLMALAAVDECVRNLVCVGADPDRIAILDNFCWPSCRKPQNLASLVRAAEGCYDAAKAFGTPFVSGKDSLNNQFTTEDGRTIEIPPTLLITGIGIVPDRLACVTSDAKRAGHVLLLVGETTAHMAGTMLQTIRPTSVAAGGVPRVDLVAAPKAARAIHGLMANRLVRAAHDCSDGGLLVAVAEMLIGSLDRGGSALGCQIDLGGVTGNGLSMVVAAFAETPSRWVLEVAPDQLGAVRSALAGIPHFEIATLDGSGRLRVRGAATDLSVVDLHRAWTSPLDW